MSPVYVVRKYTRSLGKISIFLMTVSTKDSIEDELLASNTFSRQLLHKIVDVHDTNGSSD